MAVEVLGKCPVCGGKTEVVKIYCPLCETSMEGHFKLCKFCALTDEQKAFIDVFIKCRGNIKEVEKELGVSYPTVKNKLEDAAAALGYKEDLSQADKAEKRKSVLDRLNSGEISVEEALEMLKE
ncbi:MAG TPA: DUF2089 domain-containing protein [Clostridiaceae bacterium]|nr:DUF2089 domain-containing protein [Clostridiaceae bacterium]